MIRVSRLSKTFRVHQKEPGLAGSLRSLFTRKWVEKHAVKNVSLNVSSGEIVGLVGANGAGKTTLVKMLAGIIHPTSGTAEVLGRVPWNRHPEFQSRISLIMGQKAQLWWDLPAADCFLLLKEIYGIRERDFKERLGFLSRTLDVESQLKVQIRRLSLGERMKMELIAALLHEPRVVFLDEPTIGLDLTAQRAIRKFILEYRSLRAPAMILTSHYMEDIESLCERIVIIREGEIVYDGAASRLMTEHAPDKVFTAELSGTSQPASVWPAALGKVLVAEPGFMRIGVPRDKTAEAAAHLLRSYPVADFKIEEADIGTIIERLMRKGAA